MKQEITTQNTANTPNTVNAETLKKYLRAANLVGHLTDAEVDQFIQISTAFGLNPFKREIYASKYGNNFSIVVGYETYIKRAERSGLLSGWKVTTEGSVNLQNPNQSDLKAIVTIHRQDFKFEFVHEVFFSEYCQRTKAGQLTKFWREKPITMIKKVAMSQGFRLCFSDELGGLPYTKEEIGNETIDTEAHVVESIQSPKKEIEPISIEEQFKEAEKMLQEANDREAVVKIWKGFPDLQKEEDFVKMMKDKNTALNEAKEKADKEHLEESKAPEIEEKDVEIVESEDIPQQAPRMFNNSVQYDAKEAIRYIKEMTEENEIIEFVSEDKRSTVNAAAKQRIDEISNDQNEQS